MLNLEGLWTRYDDPSGLLAEVAGLDGPRATAPAAGDLRRADQARADHRRGSRRCATSGVTVAGSLSPQRTKEFAKTVVDAGCDMFVIRGTTVSAEHVSGQAEPLNLKEFIYELDVPVIVGGCATYQAALHLMRTGAAGVLVGFGGGAAHTTRTVLGIAVPMATRGRRRGRRAARLPRRVRRPLRARDRRRLDRPLRRHRQGDRLRRRRGDGRLAARPRHRGARAAATTGAPRRGTRTLPRGERVEIGTVGTLEEILFGPSRVADGTMNLVGALRRAMATTGYTELKEFQRVEVVVQ